MANVCQFHTTDYFGRSEPPIPFKGGPRDRYVFMAFFAVLTFERIVNLLSDQGRPESYPDGAELP